jgi:hypothetical protein
VKCLLPNIIFIGVYFPQVVFEGFYENSNANFEDILKLNQDEVDMKVDLLYSIINDASSKIPCKMVNISQNDKHWVTPIIKLLIKNGRLSGPGTFLFSIS